MSSVRIIVLVLSVAVIAACGGGQTLTPPSSASPAPIASAAVSTPVSSAKAAATAASTALACASPAQPIVEFTEGPYYKAGAPQRTTLLATGVSGTALVLTGYVVSRSCQPIANAKLDFWQADGSGNYDNSGYTLRGWQLTDANGAYRLENVSPGPLPGPAEHIHFKGPLNRTTAPPPP